MIKKICGLIIEFHQWHFLKGLASINFFSLQWQWLEWQTTLTASCFLGSCFVHTHPSVYFYVLWIVMFGNFAFIRIIYCSHSGNFRSPENLSEPRRLLIWKHPTLWSSYFSAGWSKLLPVHLPSCSSYAWFSVSHLDWSVIGCGTVALLNGSNEQLAWNSGAFFTAKTQANHLISNQIHEAGTIASCSSFAAIASDLTWYIATNTNNESEIWETFIGRAAQIDNLTWIVDHLTFLQDVTGLHPISPGCSRKMSRCPLIASAAITPCTHLSLAPASHVMVKSYHPTLTMIFSVGNANYKQWH